MENTFVLTVIIIVVALLFDFTNGFNDSANIVATMISTRALSPRAALWIASIFEFIGAAFLGTAVARMVASGIIEISYLHNAQCSWMILAALAGAITWNVISWILRVPSSSSHALVGGLIGAFVTGFGIGAVQWNNLLMIGIIMVIAPVMAFLFSFIITRAVFYIGQWLTPKANLFFKKAQILSSIGLALSHGTNDAQKTMGVITISLIALGWTKPGPDGIVIPLWVIFTCAGMIALGIGSGAQRIIHTLGRKIYKIKPVHGFCSQTSSALVIYCSAFFGFFISTSQTVSTAIAGSGAAERVKKVQWETVSDMIFAWFITVPAAASAAAGYFMIFKMFGKG